MKALSIQQPWATLVASGLKDVENRKWALKALPQRVLIHAGARRQPITDGNMPYPWYWHVENWQKMGLLPPLERTPASAIVGVADIAACQAGNRSLWACRGEGAQYQWVMKNARMFREPILGVKGMLGLFDVPIAEGALPEFAEIRLPRREGRALRLPLCRSLFEELASGERDSLELNLVGEFAVALCGESAARDAEGSPLIGGCAKPLPTDTLVAECGGEELALAVCMCEAADVRDRDGGAWLEEDDLGRMHRWRVGRITVE